MGNYCGAWRLNKKDWKTIITTEIPIDPPPIVFPILRDKFVHSSELQTEKAVGVVPLFPMRESDSEWSGHVGLIDGEQRHPRFAVCSDSRFKLSSSRQARSAVRASCAAARGGAFHAEEVGGRARGERVSACGEHSAHGSGLAARAGRLLTRTLAPSVVAARSGRDWTPPSLRYEGPGAYRGAAVGGGGVRLAVQVLRASCTATRIKRAARPGVLCRGAPLRVAWPSARLLRGEARLDNPRRPTALPSERPPAVTVHSGPASDHAGPQGRSGQSPELTGGAGGALGTAVCQYLRWAQRRPSSAPLTPRALAA
ncbi:unnamed protein product [Lampetra fluviatilis]